jgi:hypothetical protein
VVPIDASITVLDDIRMLLAAPDTGAKAPSLAELDDTLTTGYATALQLEAERWRLERRAQEVTARIAAGEGGDGDTVELTTLTDRMATADEDLLELRRALGHLRARASALRAA